MNKIIILCVIGLIGFGFYSYLTNKDLELKTVECVYEKNSKNGKDKSLLKIKYYNGYIYEIYKKQEFKCYTDEIYESSKELIVSVHGSQEYKTEKDFETRIRKSVDETKTIVTIDESDYHNTTEEDLNESFHRIPFWNHKSKDGKFEYEDYIKALSDDWVCKASE